MEAAPIAGFVAKLTSPDGTLHYLNICSHPVIERPLDPADREVGDDHLRTRGLENLRVPLATGTARTIAVPGSDEEAVCFDVVFSPAVLAVALPPGSEDTPSGASCDAGSSTPMQDPMLTRVVRMRLVELALKNAQEELKYPLGRASDVKLPRGLTYKGGVDGSRQPVPIPMLRQLIAAKKAAERQKEVEAAPGPWRSRRDAAGLSTRAKIEELDVDETERRKAEPLIKKGFLNAAKSKGREIYPDGSDEGMLYNASNSGDPLGYIPKGLRSRVNVVDTATATAEQQKQMMEQYAEGKSAGGGGGGGGGASKRGGSQGTGASGDMGVAKGFLNGAAELYPDGSSEGAGGVSRQSAELDALRQLAGNRDDWEKMAAETDPNEFLSELAQFGSVLGLGDAMPPAPPSAPKARSTSAAAAPPPPSASAEVQPEHELMDAGEGEALVLRVSLPELEGLADVEVDVSADRFRMRATGKYALDLTWPRPVSADDAKAKWLRKSRTLQVTAPTVV
jgi:hypothetical protein